MLPNRTTWVGVGCRLQQVACAGLNQIYVTQPYINVAVVLASAWRVHTCRVSQNHIYIAVYVGQNRFVYTVYVWYLWQGNHQIYGHIYTVLANPTYTHFEFTYQLLVRSVLLNGSQQSCTTTTYLHIYKPGLRTHTNTHAHTHTQTHTQSHIPTNECIRRNPDGRTHTETHKQTHTRTYAHTLTHLAAWVVPVH